MFLGLRRFCEFLGVEFLWFFRVYCLDFASFHQELWNCKSAKQKAPCAFPSPFEGGRLSVRLLLLVWDPGQLGALRQLRMPPAVVGPKRDHSSMSYMQNGCHGQKLFSLERVIGRHSLRKQKAKAE